ncbi:MAG: phosphoribosylanthranilate isomerase [Gammaproteobacteria bacterium]|nr:phosphoribosylanthranilate isomerase [Gammaproteobacteria bacterium]
MRIKICGVTSAEIVDTAVAEGVDAIGFVFAESPRQVDTALAAGLMQRLPPWVAAVAVTRHPPAGFSDVLAQLAPAWWQSDRRDLENVILPPGVRSIPVIREGEDTADLPPWFVYEGAQSGRGTTVDWSRAAQLAQRGRMILAGGLNAANVAAAIRTVRPWAVDVSSGVETAPGRKCATLIREFVAAVRQAEREIA